MNDFLKYQSLEEAIVSRLTSKLAADFQVIAMPDVEADFKKSFQKGRVTVAYRKSDFKESATTDPVAQPETAFVEVVLECRKRRGNDGLFAMQKQVSDALIGWRPPNWNRLFAKQHEFTDRVENTWIYCFTVCCNGMLVECRDQETLPILTNPTLNQIVVLPNAGNN